MVFLRLYCMNRLSPYHRRSTTVMRWLAPSKLISIPLNKFFQASSSGQSVLKYSIVLWSSIKLKENHGLGNLVCYPHLLFLADSKQQCPGTQTRNWASVGLTYKISRFTGIRQCWLWRRYLVQNLLQPVGKKNIEQNWEKSRPGSIIFYSYLREVRDLEFSSPQNMSPLLQESEGEIMRAKYSQMLISDLIFFQIYHFLCFSWCQPHQDRSAQLTCRNR